MRNGLEQTCLQFLIQDLGIKGLRVYGMGVKPSGTQGKGSELRIWGKGFRVNGSERMAQG